MHLAQRYDLAPVGTIAHEWIMGIAAIEGYAGSNARAMELWDVTYPSGALSIALTDTFSTKPFFEDFIAHPERSRKWKGLRQDSGDPRKFISVAKAAFERVGADPKESEPRSTRIHNSIRNKCLLTGRLRLLAFTELIVFSDGLDIKKCFELEAAADEAGIGASFGVGTFLTNGKPLNCFFTTLLASIDTHIRPQTSSASPCQYSSPPQSSAAARPARRATRAQRSTW